MKLAILMLGLSSLAFADTLDLSKYQKGMHVYRDGNGRYIVMANSYDEAGWAVGHYLPHRFFVGDGKDFHQIQDTGEASTSNGNTYSELHVSFEDSRFKKDGQSDFTFKFGKYSLSCGNTKTSYSELGSDEALKLVKSAKFHSMPEVLEPYMLFKSNSGEHIYLTRNKTNRALRAFVGPLGQLKEIGVEDAVTSGGGPATFILSDGRVLQSSGYRGSAALYPKEVVEEAEKDDGPALAPIKAMKVIESGKYDSKRVSFAPINLGTMNQIAYDLSKLGIPGVGGPEPKAASPCDAKLPVLNAPAAQPAKSTQPNSEADAPK